MEELPTVTGVALGRPEDRSRQKDESRAAQAGIEEGSMQSSHPSDAPGLFI